MGEEADIPAPESAPVTCKHCGKPAFLSGVCIDCFSNPPKKGKGKSKGKKTGAIEPDSVLPKQSEEETSKEEPARPVTAADVQGMVVAMMFMMGTTIDESLMPVDDKGKMKPHIKDACAQMQPWFEIYGDSFVKLFPWFGLAGGLFALAAPGYESVSEIIAGVRKPRMARSDPSDVYTDKGKAAGFGGGRIMRDITPSKKPAN